jgi:ATP-dependent RNA helicase DeaD
MAPEFIEEGILVTSFSDYSLPEPLLRAVRELNYTTPTPVQEAVIPWLLENDRDLVALAQTGTGKTAAFGLPIIGAIDIEQNAVQTLILCPTRELCLQIHSDFTGYAKFMPRIRAVAVYGGAPMVKQRAALKKGAHIVVGTPGRVFDMINQGVLELGKVSRLVLDEADEMLNMGFKEDLFNIMSHTPAEKNILLFSATMPREVDLLAKTFMQDPHRIAVGGANQGAENIDHFCYKVHASDKYLALKRIVDMTPRIYGIVFCRTRSETQEIATKLQHDGYNADALHGDLSQGQRELVMTRFRSRYVQLLVATDVAARGLDVDDLTHVINYQVPLEPDVYIHRSGRTGRAGKSGIALTILHSKEMGALRGIENRLGREIPIIPVPSGRQICEKQLFHFIDNVERVEINTEEIESFLPSVYKKLSWLSREDLIQRFVSVEFNRFLNYYKDLPDLTAGAAKRSKEEKKTLDFTIFRLEVGFTSELTKRDLMRYINRLHVTRGIEIGRIDIFASHTLVELETQFREPLLKAFARNPLNGLDPHASVVRPAPRRKDPRE